MAQQVAIKAQRRAAQASAAARKVFDLADHQAQLKNANPAQAKEALLAAKQVTRARCS